MKHIITSGCFDIIHAGHVTLLAHARSLGDFLTVGLNSDESVRGLKGLGRPVNRWEDRREVLLALECVDEVVITNGPDVARFIMQQEADIWVKGGDYTMATLDASEVRACEMVNTRIEIVPITIPVSTTAILNQLKKTMAPT